MRAGRRCLAVTMIDETAQSDPIDPSTVLDLYLQDRETDLADSTRRSHRYVIEKFVEWCDANDFTDMRSLDGRDLHDFRLDRRENINGTTLRSQLGIIRLFIRFAESIEAVPTGLAERIRLPQVEQKSRDTRLETEMADVVLDHLRKFQYASRDHALIRLLWVSGVRVGTARSFDVEDLDTEAQRLAVRHRPETDTPLKNSDRGERLLALDEQTTETLADYVEHSPTVTDRHGRNPLFTTERGRAGRSTLRRAVYRWTRPCQRGEDCPHERERDDCEAYKRVSKASDCPSTRSPHDVRRGAISFMLTEDTPVRAISDRANVSEGVIDQHYDVRSEREKTEYRREFFE
jgi:site-specific recombinase XerD